MSLESLGADLRRVVTGINPSGKSIVIIDGKPAEALITGPSGLFEIWSETGEPTVRADSRDRAAGDVVLAPPPGGVRVRWFVTEPTAADMNAEEQRKQYDEVFAAMGGDDAQVDNQRHPGMHLTNTTDIVMVASGQVKLVLEDDEVLLGPGDVVVQRGTNHAWEAIGSEPAVCLGVLIDRQLAD